MAHGNLKPIFLKLERWPHVGKVDVEAPIEGEGDEEAHSQNFITSKMQVILKFKLV